MSSSNGENDLPQVHKVASPEWPYDVEKAFQETVEKAIQSHLRNGNPVYVGKDGMQVKINPDGSETIVGQLKD